MELQTACIFGARYNSKLAFILVHLVILNIQGLVRSVWGAGVCDVWREPGCELLCDVMRENGN